MGWGVVVCPSGCRSSKWAEPNGPERQGNLASDGNDEKSIVMLPESNLQGGKSRRDREKQGQRNNKKEKARDWRRGESDHPRKKAWYWFCVHVEVAAH